MSYLQHDGALARHERRSRALMIAFSLFFPVVLIAVAGARPADRPSDVVIASHVVSVPDYAPTGADADFKRAGAAGIDDRNAIARAKTLEASLDTQISAAEQRAIEKQKLAREAERRALKAKAAAAKARQRELLQQGVFQLSTLRSYHR